VKTDSGTGHRVAATFALGFASATIVSLAGVFALDARAARVKPAVAVDLVPDASWPMHWLDTAVPASAQQQAAAQQWLHLVLILGALAAAIACVNALIGLLSHANERRYENALRGLIGASPNQLRRSVFLSALINVLLGIATGAPVGMLLALSLRRAWPARLIEAATPISWTALAVAIAVAVAVGAAQMTSKRFHKPGWLGDALSPDARRNPGWGTEDLRALLTTAQIACAVALTTVGVLVSSYANAQPSRLYAQSQRYVARVSLQEYQRVRAAGFEAESIASPGALLGLGITAKVVSDCGQCARGNMYTPLFPVETQHHVVGARFFEVAGIRLREGREFNDEEADEHSVVISKTFARMAFDDPHPTGKRILVGGFAGEWYHVIGVVDDIATAGLRYLEPEPGAFGVAAHAGYAPAIYFSARAHPPRSFDVIVQSRQPVQLAGISFTPLAAMIQRAAAPQTWFARVLMLLGVMLCAAALIGSFTSTMLMVRERRDEIAIRRAVGATRRDVWWLIYKLMAGVIMRGVAAGVILSMALARAVEVFVPGLPVLNVNATLSVIFAIACVSFCAITWPLSRTAMPG
jgi:ABC-type lipoprotein release transport system permease subunit